MKKSFVFAIVLVLSIMMVIQQSCKTSKDEDPVPNGGEWTQEDENQVNLLLTLLDESKIQFHNYLQSQDTLSALQSLAGWYTTNSSVSWAQAGAQGVAFQFKNGFRGLYFVNGKDEPQVKFSNEPANVPGNTYESYKSVPSMKRMYLGNPHYNERIPYFTDLVNTYNSEFGKVFKDGFVMGRDDGCGLWTFGDLKKSGYGFVHIYSHGYAWPNEETLTEVYLMTGQTPTPQWTSEYQNDIKKGNILFGYAEGIQRLVYWINPQFIANNNDFSKDTLLIYGGFCYSFLGNWPNLVHSFASGGYFGFSWSVWTNKNAAWAKSLWKHLSDTTTVVPWSTATWLNGTPEIPKEYYNEEDKKQVRIMYAGNNDLTFWEPRYKYSITATASGGAPIVNPGNTGVDYEFKCLDRNQEIGQGLRFQWIFGDGTPQVEIENNSKVNHTWQTAGTCKISVRVYHIQSGKLLGIAEADAKLDEYHNYLSLLQTMKSIETVIYGNGHHYFDDNSQCPDLIVFNYYVPDPGGNLAWDGQNFSASGSYNNNWEHVSLTGYVSMDADSLLYLKAVYTYTGGLNVTRDSLIYELRNIPLFTIYEGQPPYATFKIQGAQSQSHVMNLYYKKEKTWQQYLYYHHSDWDYVTLQVKFMFD